MVRKLGISNFCTIFLTASLSLGLVACKKGGSAPTTEADPSLQPTDYSPAIVINSGTGFTTTTTATLSFSAVNNPAEMYVTQTAGCSSGGAWETYATSKSWNLVLTNASNTIYYKVRGSKNESSCVSATVIHDTIAPTSPALTINSGALVTSSATVSLNPTATDALQMYITNTASCSSGGSWESLASPKSWSLPASESSNTIYVKFRDGAGNESSCVSASITHDSIAPTNPSLTINSGNATTGSQNASLDLAAGGAAEMYITDVAGCASGGTWETFAGSKSWTLPNANAVNTVYAKFRDAAMNVTSCISASITHDSTIPVLTITDPVSGGFANSTTQSAFSISGACGANGQSVNVSGSVTTSTTCSAGAWTTNLNVSGLSDGTFGVTINHSNSSGTSAPSVSRQFMKDTVAPTGATIAINSGSTHTNDTLVTLSLAATSGYEMYVTNTSGCASGGTWETLTATKAWTLAQTNATATVYVRFRDEAGNNTSCISDSIVHDTVAPNLTITSPAANSYINASNASAQTISGACNEAGRTVTFSGPASGSATCNGSSYSGAANFSAASEGSLTLTATISDLAGNTKTATRSFIKDTIAPTGTLQINSGDEYTTSPELSLTHTNDGTQMYVTDDSTCASGGTWTTSASSSSLITDQTDLIYLYAKFRDAALNESTCYEASIMLDVTSPIWNDVPIHANFYNSTTASPFVIYEESAVDSDSGVAGYQYAIGTQKTGANSNNMKDWTSVTGGTFAAGGMTLPNGTYFVNMRAYDFAGNYAYVSSNGWMIDNIPPNLTLSTPLDNTVISEYDFKMMGSCEQAYPVAISYGSNASGDTSVTCISNTFIAYGSLSGPSGNRTVTLTQTDSGGNTTTVNLTLNFQRPVDIAGTVLASTKLSDGSFVYGGTFQTTSTNRDVRLVRLNTDGSKDATFDVFSGFNGQVIAIAEMTDGSLLVGGDFTAYRAHPAYRIAKISSTGVLDTTFNPTLGSNGFNNAVRAIAVVGSDIYVGGDFTTYRGATAKYIAKLSSSGVLDTTFSPAAGANGFDNRIRGLASDGSSIFAGGDFKKYRNATANRVAKLDLNGNLDTAFSPASGANGVNGIVRAVVSDGSAIFFGGDFTTFKDQVANRVAKVSTSGSLDSTFNPSSGSNGITSGNSYVYAMTINGSNIYLAGSFTRYRGAVANRVAKVDLSSGALDTTFNPGSGGNGTNSSINAVAVSGSAVYLGGIFTTYRGAVAPRIAKTNTSGVLDTTFNPASYPNGFGNTVNSVILSASGKVYVGGLFSSYRGDYMTSNLVHIQNDGTVNTNLSPQGGVANGMNSTVRALAWDGSHIYVGGDFTSCSGSPCNRLIAVDTSNSPKSGFTFTSGAGPNGVVRALALTGAGEIFVGGDFTNFSGTGASRLIKISTSDGTMPGTYSAGSGLGPNNSVRAIAIDGSGNIFVGGLFTTMHGQQAKYIAKIDSVGGTDYTFTPDSGANGTNNYVYALAADGTNVYAGGAFTLYRGSKANRIAKIAYDGTLDTTFSPQSGGNGLNGGVNAIAINGSDVFVGGSFSTYRGKVANNLCKVSKSAGVLDTVYNPATGANGTTGPSPAVYTLLLDSTTLHAGGVFSFYRGVQAVGRVKTDISSGAQVP